MIIRHSYILSLSPNHYTTHHTSLSSTTTLYYTIPTTTATPEPVNNCTVENVSSTSASVRCQAGWDGGLAQTFTLSVTPAASASKSGTREDDGRKEAAPRVLANTSTAPKPEFFLTGLEPGTKYVLTIMGVNKKGESEPMRLAIFTLKDVAEKRTSPGEVNYC